MTISLVSLHYSESTLVNIILIVGQLVCTVAQEILMSLSSVQLKTLKECIPPDNNYALHNTKYCHM